MSWSTTCSTAAARWASSTCLSSPSTRATDAGSAGAPQGQAWAYYLDFYWPDLGVVVEVDGIHHAWANNVIGDALRQNALALAGDTVLRLPLLGYRLAREEFFDQIEAALAAAARRTAA